MPNNQFDALLADIAAGELDLPADPRPEVDLAEAGRRMETIHDAGMRRAAVTNAKIAKALGTYEALVTETRARGAAFDRQREMSAMRERIAGYDLRLKAMLADGLVSRGGATAEQVIRAQQQIAALATQLHQHEQADGGVHGGDSPLPPGMSAASFRTALQRAMADGRVQPYEAVRCDAGLMRGEAPQPELLARVLAA